MSDNNGVVVDSEVKAEFQKAAVALKSTIEAIKKLQADLKTRDALAQALETALEA